MNPAFEQIIQDRGWDAPGADFNLRQEMSNIEARLTRRLPPGVDFTLTTFQKKVISDPKFWRDWGNDTDCQHIMIQGATSAGKTLVSELNILDTLLHGERKTVVLVPLKAMVHERTEQFRKDMPGFNIYGASSDHMEYDEQILNGGHHVAVIVYEKFFSMLSQSSNKLMESCGLLVVDELSMLSKEQRGPKLELVLEIIKEKYPDTRIMCLATCDCSTEKICQWLNISEPIISTARPVALEENILLTDGAGICRKIPANHETGDPPPEESEIKIEVPGYRSDWRPIQKRKELLRVVLRKVFSEIDNPRLLIFVGSQSTTSDIAGFLKDTMPDLFPPIVRQGSDQIDPAYKEFMQRVSACDRDEGQEELIKEFLPRGIAYHHAGISTTLREVIEEEFQRPNSFVKVIVATETLTIGVNMPFDVMIMVTHKVPRGLSEHTPLTHQEYRNYIGRAGRLGQSNRPGVTYLFVDKKEELKRYQSSYYKTEEVTSALTKASEKELAPYYLSLLANRSNKSQINSHIFNTYDVQDLFDNSLSNACGPRRTFHSGRLCDYLLYGYLASPPKGGAMGAPIGGLIPMVPQYAISTFGINMAPYALSIDTYICIFWYFYEGYKHGGLPSNYSRDDIESDRYLLEILYHLCQHPEIASSSLLSFPDMTQRSDRIFQAKHLVVTHLKKLLAEEDENGSRCSVLWCDDLPDEAKEENGLWQLTNQSNLVGEHSILSAAMRAMLLYHWTKGKTLSEIKSITGFKDITKLTSGDIERMAELVSFHLDAVYKCLGSADTEYYPDQDAYNAIYALQTRIKYGMSRDLVQLANKHIYGLDRSRLLALKKDAQEMNLTPLQYLYTAPADQRSRHLSLSHQMQLLDALERRSSVKKFDTLMDIVSKDVGSKLTPENKSCLRTIANWDGSDPGELYESLEKLMDNEAFKSVHFGSSKHPSCASLWLDGRTLRLGMLGKAPREDPDALVSNYFRNYKNDSKILLVPSRNLVSDWDTSNLDRIVRSYGCGAILNTTFLALILANTIHKDLSGGTELFEFLSDARGIFTESEYKLFCPSNYILQERDTAQPPRFRLLFSHNAINIGELQIALSKTDDLNHYEILPWGSQLSADRYDFAEVPTILLLNREQITHSESLSKFLYAMENQHFRHCVLLLDSDAAEQTWNTSACLESSPCNVWRGHNNKIRKIIAADGQEAIPAIREFITSWNRRSFLIGVSYAHYDARYHSNTIENGNSDIEKLNKIVSRLRDIYGEDNILFDQYSPAKLLFTMDGQERSLAAYAGCRVNLVLWNYWTRQNGNCRQEYDVIRSQCDAGDAKCIYLQGGHDTDPAPPFGQYATSLDDVDSVIQSVRNHLRSLFAEENTAFDL